MGCASFVKTSFDTALGLRHCCGRKPQNFFIMIDTTQLTQLISAFRVETEKESISPETVGSLLQNITDLLANASCGVFLMLSRHHAIHYLCAHTYIY